MAKKTKKKKAVKKPVPKRYEQLRVMPRKLFNKDQLGLPSLLEHMSAHGYVDDEPFYPGEFDGPMD